MVTFKSILILCVVAVAIALDTPEKKLAKANNAFGLKLFMHQATEKGRFANIFFSPLSISMAAGMLNLGARGNTQTQLKDVLGFKSVDPDLNQAFQKLVEVLNDQRNKYTLKVANRAYAHENATVVSQFITDIEMYFKAKVEKENFVADSEGARTRINKWVSNFTMDKIPELLQSGIITPATVMVLVNAVYYKAAWKFMFGEQLTEKKPFSLTHEKTFQVDMMMFNNSKANLKYFESQDLSCKVVELPYDGEQVSMYIFVPWSTEGLPELEKKLDMETLNEILVQRLVKTEVSLKMPKFKLEVGLDLKMALQELGVTDVFDANKANLSGIADNLVVSDAIHKATIDVDEKGTEASAATVVTISRTSIQKTAQVNANRPFMFAIRENSTGTLLFLGRMAIPPGAESMVDDLVSNADIHHSLPAVLMAAVFVALSAAISNRG